MFLSVSFSDAERVTRSERKAQREQQVRTLIDSGVFTFEAETAHPMSGRQVNLSAGYKLTLNGDSVEAYLPYFGRAYVASYGSNDSGIKFKEKASLKKVSQEEKNGLCRYEISVSTTHEKYELLLEVGKSGYASLIVNSLNRQTISFSGELGAVETD